MLSKKMSRLIYELSRNSRETTKRLGKTLRISQQSASYMILSAIKKGSIKNFYTLIDPARFGLTNIIVLYNYKNFEVKKVAEIKNFLKENQYITMIEETSLWADLVVNYTVPNLSLFNKENQNFLYKYKKDIKRVATYPIIVKHLFARKYLKAQKEDKEIVLSGDRDVIRFNDKQKALMRALYNNANASIISLSKTIGTDTKTTSKIKKTLEELRVIRQYSTTFDYKQLGIFRELVFLNLDSDDQAEVKKFITFCRYHKNILTIAKLIGEFDFIITIEKLGDHDVLSEIRKEFHIADFKLMKSHNLLKNLTVPEIVLYLT